MDRRQTVTALNADIAGYSQLMADDHVSTTIVVEDCRKLVSRLVSENDGVLVNFVGDNFMAVFSGAAQAIRAAIAITADIERRDLRNSSSAKVRFRMGLDWGEVTVAEEQYYGDVLNIAARIQSVAKPGGLCVSGRVYRQLDEPALRFRSIGRRKLKNIPELVEIYEFADFPGEQTMRVERPPLNLESPTVAVLPIHIKNADSPVAEGAEVLRQELIHRLTSVPQLKVINAGFETGRQERLTVARYMIETGVHQYGETIRVFATMFDVTSMNIVKSFKWFVSLTELFELAERLAEDVARSIEVELIVGEPAGLYSDLDDPEAIEKVYLGWYHLRSETREGWARALDLFQQVLESHPDLPYGYVLSAFASWLGAASGYAPDVDASLARSRELADAAQQIGDLTGMAQAIQGAVLMSQGKHEEALAAIENLEILRPTCDVTYGLEGSIRRYLGQWQQSVDLLDTAMRLTGINKPWYPTVKACSLFLGEQIEEAMSTAEMVLEYQPGNLEALVVLAAAQAELGMDRRARATLASLNEQFPAVDAVAWLNANPYLQTERVKRWKDSLTRIDA